MNTWDSIMQGLNEAVAFARGKVVGADVHQLEVPAVDVAAIKAPTGLPISAPVVPKRAGRSQA